MSEQMQIPDRPISEWYVEWANTLDSAGEDSGPVQKRLENPEALLDLHDAMYKAIIAGRRIDRLKKHLFYGRDLQQMDHYKVPDPAAHIIPSPVDHNGIRLIHAVLGLFDEAGELMQALFEHLFYGRELDLVNLREEFGDTGWYQALGARYLGDETLEPIQQANYRKLVTRYPKGAWQDTRALARDLDAERKALESGVVIHNHMTDEEDANCPRCDDFPCRCLWILRTTNDKNHPIWIVYNKQYSIVGKVSDTKTSILSKFRKQYGTGPIKDGEPWYIIRYSDGIMLQSEAAMTMAKDKGQLNRSSKYDPELERDLTSKHEVSERLRRARNSAKKEN